jgi:hypothetical protein
MSPDSLELEDMPRKPFLRHPAVHKAREQGFKWTMGSAARLERPEHIAKIGECLTLWPDVDTQLALLLASLTGANAGAMVAVYSVLRRSTGRMEALKAAADVHLDAQGREVIAAICMFVQSVEAHRNDLAHGQWGVSRLIPDGILWLDGAFAIDFHVRHRQTIIIEKQHHMSSSKIEENLFYYKLNDFAHIRREIIAVCEVLFTMRTYVDGFYHKGRPYRTSIELLDRLKTFAPIRQALTQIIYGAGRSTPSEPDP